MAKTYKNIYPRIYDFAALHAAYCRARKGHRASREVLRFEQDLEGNLIQLQNELIWGTYRTGRYHYFEILEPKKRLVAALPFRDRVVQHALVAAIEPIWEKRFIGDSYACRVGRGMHAGADRAERFLRQVKREHGKVYVYKADIAKYFASIDHEILKGLLQKHIGCRKTLTLIREMIDSSPGQTGIPIGNLTSQLFANIYLHELDLFIKNTLREPRYIRYMDDTVIVHHDKKHLGAIRAQIEAFLCERLKLQTNSKSQIYPVALTSGRPLDFLGYRIWLTHRRLRKTSVNRMRRALKTMVGQYAKGDIALDKVKLRIASWLGHARHADSFRIRAKLLSHAIFRRNP
jgi:retron-type reverse transcriptase